MKRTPRNTSAIIRQALADSHMTQTELAEGMGVTQPSLSAMLSGSRRLTGDSLIRAHDVLTDGDATAAILEAIKTGVPLV